MTMGTFTIEGFAEGCKSAMAGTDDKRQAAQGYLENTMRENEPADIISALNAAIPEGADIGEMIVHTSPELTMLYGRVPPRFQSGIHNHTVFACIGQLQGAEINVSYQRTEDGKGLQVHGTTTNNAGGVISMPEEAIHHIENPNTEVAHALHIYGGDFGAVKDQRSLWTSEGYMEKPFNFPDLLLESGKAMKLNNNTAGLEALVKAIPAAKPLVDSL
jgi:predicted metal-dependent enzyme (double-stranded beta helix superfamily)